jgi:hypothetical protein
MFTICVFISPDIDGHRAPITNVPRPTTNEPPNKQTNKPKKIEHVSRLGMFSPRCGITFLLSRIDCMKIQLAESSDHRGGRGFTFGCWCCGVGVFCLCIGV